MSDEGSDLANRWPLALGVLALVGVGLWWLLSPGPEPASPAPPEPEEDVEVAEAPSPDPEPAEAPDPEPEDFDPDRLARILLDGGTALEAEEAADLYDPPAPTRGVEEPIEVAAERMRARAEAAAERPAPAREPLTPQQELRQATFWRGMLDDRIDAMREQVTAAEQAGDAAAATRARRIMQRLEAQRPAVNRQIERLEGQLEPDAP